MSELTTQVEKLIEKATSTSDANEALKFSQAALNAAQTYHALKDYPQQP